MSVRAGPFSHREVREFVWAKINNPRFAGPIYHMPFPGHRTQAQVRASAECAPRYCSECNRTVSQIGAERCTNILCKASG